MSDLKFSNHAAGRDDHSGRAQHALPALDFLGREGGAGGVRGADSVDIVHGVLPWLKRSNKAG